MSPACDAALLLLARSDNAAQTSASVLAQVAAAAQKLQIVKPFASEPSVCPVMYLEVAIGAAALAYAACSAPDLSTESLPVPGSPVLSVEPLPELPLAIRQCPRFS